MCLIVMTHLLPSLASIAACLTTPPTQKHKKKKRKTPLGLMACHDRSIFAGLLFASVVTGGL